MSARATYLRAIGQGRDQLVASAARAGFAAPVPTAPRWCVGDLVVHVGNVHGWATTILRTREEQPQEFDAPPPGVGPDDAALLDWYAAQAGALLALLESGTPGDDEPCWTFGPPATAAFWPRRQAHELAVHALDAELASGNALPDALAAWSPELAADGVDEVLTVMLPRVAQFRPRPELGAPLCVIASDVGRRWVLEVDGRLRSAGEAGDPADVAPAAELIGPAAALCALLWKRARLAADGPALGVAVDGDAGVVEALLAARLTP